jgi:phosphoribosylamine--glycine ligase
MGAYSPLADLPDDEIDRIVDTIHQPILAELARRGTPFRGFLYTGLILTDRGPVLLECNARLGDPEAQVILPRLASALGPLLLAAARESLPADGPRQVAVIPGASVGIVLAAAGYPGAPRRDDAIAGLDAASADGAIVFHAGTRQTEGGTYETDGGRVLTVVGRGVDLAAARAAAERAADEVSWAGMQRRRDIAAVIPRPVFAPAGAGR